MVRSDLYAASGLRAMFPGRGRGGAPRAGRARTPRQLLVTAGALAGTRVSLEDSRPILIGRADDSTLVLDDDVPGTDGRPGWFAPYLEPGPLECAQSSDYANPAARLASDRTFEWMHPLGDVVTALIDAGLVLRFLHEHDAVPWAMFGCLVRAEDGMYRWPDRPWLPLSYSLAAEKPAGG